MTIDKRFEEPKNPEDAPKKPIADNFLHSILLKNELKDFQDFVDRFTNQIQNIDTYDIPTLQKLLFGTPKSPIHFIEDLRLNDEPIRSTLLEMSESPINRNELGEKFGQILSIIQANQKYDVEPISLTEIRELLEYLQKIFNSIEANIKDEVKIAWAKYHVWETKSWLALKKNQDSPDYRQIAEQHLRYLQFEKSLNKQLNRIPGFVEPPNRSQS